MKKRIFSLLLALAVALTLCSAAAPALSSDGEDPYPGAWVVGHDDVIGGDLYQDDSDAPGGWYSRWDGEQDGRPVTGYDYIAGPVWYVDKATGSAFRVSYEGEGYSLDKTDPILWDEEAQEFYFAGEGFVIRDGVLLRYNGARKRVIIPSNDRFAVTEIGSRVFAGRTELTRVTIPDTVTEIGSSAFEGCTGLTEVAIPESVAWFGDNAFADCTGLTHVAIPAGMSKVGWFAFSGCTGLKTVTIPVSVTNMFWTVFEDCVSVTDVYYGGTKAQWEELAKTAVISDGTYIYRHLPQAVIHCTDGVFPALPTAFATRYPVTVDGREVDFTAYALKDANGYDTNYIKLRDLAFVLNGKPCQFNVSWTRGSINITTGTAYRPNGSEMEFSLSTSHVYAKSTDVTKINGRVAELDAITLTDEGGGGYTYYKVRDLGRALGFNVGWTRERGMFIETDKPYDPSN